MNLLAINTRGILTSALSLPAGAGIQMESFHGLALVNFPIPDQIDISLESFHGLIIAQVAYP